jgi:hypothetical protein
MPRVQNLDFDKPYSCSYTSMSEKPIPTNTIHRKGQLTVPAAVLNEFSHDLLGQRLFLGSGFLKK